MATTHTRLMTFAEFEKLPGPRFGKYELRHGELFTVAPPIHQHARAQRQLRRLLEKAAGDRGVVECEFAFRALPDREFRIADVIYLTRERWDSIDPAGWLSGSPELVIEVLSPSNTVSEVNDKKILCLETGSLEFWTVDLEHRQVEVATPDGRARTYRPAETIPLFFEPGAGLSVAAIFE